jgi:hypothetical protein
MDFGVDRVVGWAWINLICTLGWLALVVWHWKGMGSVHKCVMRYPPVPSINGERKALLVRQYSIVSGIQGGTRA